MCPASLSFEDFKAVYAEAYDLGLKGCTTFRPNAVTGSVLSVAAVPSHCSPPCRSKRRAIRSFNRSRAKSST